jgi:hypothetical protein
MLTPSNRLTISFHVSGGQNISDGLCILLEGNLSKRNTKNKILKDDIHSRGENRYAAALGRCRAKTAHLHNHLPMKIQHLHREKHA